MTVAQVKTAMDDLVTAINAGDADAADVKANTSSIKASAIACAIAVGDLLHKAGFGANYQSVKRTGTEDL